MKKLRTIFLGTPEFSVPTLKSICNNESIELLATISNPDKKQNRGQKIQSPPVVTFAKENNLKFFQTDRINKDDEILEFLKKSEIDLIIVLAFSQFISQEILDLPKIGCFNIHTSILPKYRGAAPVQYALLNGDKSTGVSIQKMVKKMDAGDICFFKSTKIEDEDTALSLFEKLKIEAAECITPFISLITNNELTFNAQDQSAISFAPLIKKEDAKIKLAEHSVKKIQNMIRGYFVWPKAYLYLNEKILKIHEVEVSGHDLAPGCFKIHMGQMLVGAQDGSIRLKKIQLQGKKAMTDIDFLNGYNQEIIIT